jgi:hypothetical protein
LHKEQFQASWYGSHSSRNSLAAAQIFPFVDLDVNKIVLRSTSININGKLKLLALSDISVHWAGFDTTVFVYCFYHGIPPAREGQTSIAKLEENIRSV